MQNYVWTVVCTAAAAGLASALAPSGAKNGVKKHIKLVCALALVCTLIAPLGEFLANLGDLFAIADAEASAPDTREYYQNLYRTYLDENFDADLGSAVKEAIGREFSIPESEVRVHVSFKNSGTVGEPETITVVLSGRSKFADPAPIRDFVSTAFGAECVTAIE